MIRYALTIFLSAFLLFQVQPLIAKFILPWFGGTPAVWTTCMLFFQMMLLVGYAYAHLTSSRLTPRTQAVLHSVLLAVSLLFLPIIPNPDWKPTGGDWPAARIFLLLAVTVGIPYLLLSTTGPLLQKWFSRTHPGTSPYRLYSLSNVGSLLALVSYPFVFEPAMRLEMQAYLWSYGFGLFTVLCGLCVWLAFPKNDLEPVTIASKKNTAATAEFSIQNDSESIEPPSRFRILMWLGLAAVPSVMLLATTNQMCQEVAVVPFLWILPLSLYLISFIICFDNDIWYVRPVWCLLLVVASLAACYSLYMGTDLEFTLQIAAFSMLLFAACMTCHGELAKSKPHVEHLTLFYLMVAVGGALGGFFVVVVAPYIFNMYWELHLGMVAAVLLTMVSYFSDRNCYLYRGRPRWLWAIMILFTLGLSAALGLEAAGLDYYATSKWDEFTALFDESEDRKDFSTKFREFWDGLKDIPEDDIVERTRTFYGVLAVERQWDYVNQKYFLSLNHGRIRHGIQYQDSKMRYWITSYYSMNSGFGLAVEEHPNRVSPQGDYLPMHIGVIGLGTGSTAAYGRPGDRFRYYDINPEVKRIANKHFSYCKDSQADVQIVLGDARIKLEQELAEEKSQEFDVLAVDAFSSDAIPMHLLTRECFKLYWQHLKPDGILAVHISNRFLDLSHVVRSLAWEDNRTPILIDVGDDPDFPHVSASTWVLITTNQNFIDERQYYDESDRELPYLIWTDDYGSLRQALRSEDIWDKFRKMFSSEGEE
jgi:hypothetical protein